VIPFIWIVGNRQINSVEKYNGGCPGCMQDWRKMESE
jgi:hypothetical protein